MQENSNQIVLNKLSALAELKKPLKDIYQAWPNLHQMTLNLVDYMGELVPTENGTPLLQKCLVNAVESFKCVPDKHYGTTEQMIAFIAGLLLEAPQLIKCSIGTSHDDPVLWEPFVTSLSTFQETYPGLVKVYFHPYADVKENSMRLMILARIITVKDLYWIDKHSSLNTLLGEAA